MAALSIFDKAWFRMGVAVLTGFIFLFAAFTKLGHPDAFIQALQHYPFVVRGSEAYLTYGLALIEMVVGCGLFLGPFFSFFRKVALALLMVFILSLVSTLFGQIRIECGCFGPLFSPQPELMVVQDAVLFFLLMMIGNKPVRQHPTYVQLITGLVFFAVLVGVGRVSPSLDPLFVKLRPGYEMKSLPSLDHEAGNNGKTRLVVISDRELPRQDMQTLALAFPDYEPVLVTVGDSPIQVGPEWTVIKAKPNLIPFLTRHLPTVFMVEEDKVHAVWYGKLPTYD